MAEKSNWDILRNQNIKDTTKYHDVYSDQQLERSKIQKTQTFTSRHVVTIVVAILVGIFMYLFVSAGSYFVYGLKARDAPGLSVKGYNPDPKSYPYVCTGNGNEGVQYFSKDDINDQCFINNKRVFYKQKEDVPIPKWYMTLKEKYDDLYAKNKDKIEKLKAKHKRESQFVYHVIPNMTNSFAALISMLLVYSIVYQIMRRNYEAQTILERTDDINQYNNDRHVALPEEILQHPEFDIFPDVGATSNVQFSSMISHFMLKNKGLKKIDLTERAKEDIKDENGNIEYYKNEILVDENGDKISHVAPIIDEKFGTELFKASNQPKEVQKYWDTTKIPYNANDQHRNRQKGNIKTVAELINKDWQLPYYEPQRPAGFYLVDTAPVNTIKG